MTGIVHRPEANIPLSSCDEQEKTQRCDNNLLLTLRELVKSGRSVKGDVVVLRLQGGHFFTQRFQIPKMFHDLLCDDIFFESLDMYGKD